MVSPEIPGRAFFTIDTLAFNDGSRTQIHGVEVKARRLLLLEDSDNPGVRFSRFMHLDDAGSEAVDGAHGGDSKKLLFGALFVTLMRSWTPNLGAIFQSLKKEMAI